MTRRATRHCGASHQPLESTMKSAALVVGLTAAVFALPAAAQMTSDTTGFYVGGSIGQSKIKDCSGCDDKDTAWRVLGGYQLNRNFSPALGYPNLGEFGSTKVNAWELVGVGLLPVANQFGVYGKLGAHHSELKDG